MPAVSAKNTWPIYVAVLGVFAFGWVMGADAQPMQSVTSVIVATGKSIPLDALKKFEAALGNDETPISTQLAAGNSSYSIIVRAGDTLEGILRDQWGLVPGKDTPDYGSLISKTLAMPENKIIAARSSTTLNIHPGDQLYLPSVISGKAKSGALVVPAAAHVDRDTVNQAALAAFAATPDVQSQSIVRSASPPIGALANVETCQKGVSPFDLAKLTKSQKLVLTRPAPGTLGDRVIVVLDAGLSGNVAALAPYFAPARYNDPYQSQGGLYVPLNSGGVGDLASKTTPPSDHGTHIMTLLLGGVSGLLGSPSWQLLPVIVEGAKRDTNGSMIPDLRPQWVASGVDYVQRYRAFRIVNMSLEMQNAQTLATGIISDKQHLYVVASGNGQLTMDSLAPPPDTEVANNYANMRRLPADKQMQRVMPGYLGGPLQSNVISVAAHDNSDDKNLTGFSGHYFENVDIAAPGKCVESYVTLGDTISSSTPAAITGTSQASAIVSYAASLVSDSLGASWSPADVKARLLASSDYDSKLRQEVSSSGRLSIGAAIAARFDVIRYRVDGSNEILEEIGDIVDSGKTFRDILLCDKETIKIGNVWKIVPRYEGSIADTNARLDYIERWMAADDQFNWSWKTCTANIGNLREIRFKPAGGKTLDPIPFKNLVEVVPKHF